LQGEQYNCPECGEATEVYSRITGYYRPVGNWNEGKSQEYKERKEYIIDDSALEAKTPCACEEKKEAPKAESAVLGDGSYLFVSATCPNCKIAHAMLDKAGYKYEELLAVENVELANALGIKQAPTLVVIKGGNVEKYAGAGAIKGFLEK
jgi:ribonucleoside-triphosphate reductase